MSRSLRSLAWKWLAVGIGAMGSSGMVCYGTPAGGGNEGLPVSRYVEASEFHLQGPVLSVLEDRLNRIWIGADQVGYVENGQFSAIELPGGYAFRLALDGPRAYVGGIGEFGYVESNASGLMRYTSLVPGFQADGMGSMGEIWAIHPEGGGGVAFVGAQAMYRWDGNHFRKWILPSDPRLQAFIVNSAESSRTGATGELWLYQGGVGILRVTLDGPTLLWKSSDLPGIALWICATGLSPSDRDYEGLMIGTFDGVFIRKRSQWVRLQRISEAIKGKLVVGAVALDRDLVAVGTYASGVFIVSPRDTGEVEYYRRSCLKDDSVQAVSVSWRGDLLLGLSRGFADVQGIGSSSLFDLRNGFESGPVIAVRPWHGTVLVASPGGMALVTSKEEGMAELTSLPGIKSVLRATAATRNDLFVSGFGGIWRLGAEEKSWERERYVSADVFCMAAAPDGGNRLLFAEKSALKELELGPHGWATHDLAQDVADTPTAIVDLPNDEIWVSTVTNGIWRYKKTSQEDGTPGLRLVLHYEVGRGFPDHVRRPVLVSGRRQSVRLHSQWHPGATEDGQWIRADCRHGGVDWDRGHIGIAKRPVVLARRTARPALCTGRGPSG